MNELRLERKPITSTLQGCRNSKDYFPAQTNHSCLISEFRCLMSLHDYIIKMLYFILLLQFESLTLKFVLTKRACVFL